MQHQFLQVKNKLEADLAGLETEVPNALERFKTGAQIAGQAEEALKQLVSPGVFQTKEDEICFFKHIQPGILGKKIYYSQLFRLEADRPKKTQEDYKQFLDRELRRIVMFFEEHNALRLYVRSGSTEKDEQYFLRNSRYNNEYPLNLEGVLDTRFCTVTSFTLAELIALEEVRTYLIVQMNNLYGVQRYMPGQHQLEWTDSKTDLVELAYALYLSQSFNDGRAQLKQIFEWLETSLNIRLGNAYSHFRDIRSRKKEMASFLMRLKGSLLKRIDELQEEPRK